MLREGRRTPLTVEQLLPLTPQENPARIDSAFQGEYSRQSSRPRPLLRTIWSLEKKNLALAFLISMLHLAVLVGNPLLLRELIRWLEGAGSPDVSSGYALALALVVTSIVGSLAVHHMFQVVLRMMIRVRVPLVAIIYRKALRLTQEARQATSAGQIINLMGTDAQKFINAINVIHSLWFHPLQLALSLIALYWILGAPALTGVAVLVATLVISVVISRRQIIVRGRLMKFSDVRVALMNEILMSIRMIKFYSWEPSFQHEVQSVRAQELRELSTLAKLQALSTLIFLSTPVVVAFATFSTVVFMGGALRVSDVFSALAFFTLLRHAMLMLPDVAAAAIEANVALRRVENFLKLPELPPLTVLAGRPGAIQARAASWEWRPTIPAVSDLDLNVSPGMLLGVVGEVGSGKSALMQALLGELPLRQGAVELHGTIAYVPQQAWIQNGSVQSNILFGKPMDRARYERIIHASGLRDDLGEFPDGDHTEIGERGINLSGGQKQRISLARAAYADADIYLLDDPLSALDSRVGAHVYRELLCGVLREKTRLLVSHRLEFIERADHVIVFERGRVVEEGVAHSLLAKRGVFAALWRVHNERALRERDAHGESAPSTAMLRSEAELPQDISDETPRAEGVVQPVRQLVAAEERFSGVVDPAVYKRYLSLFAPGIFFVLLATVFVAKEFFNIGSDGWLAWWSAHHEVHVSYFIIGFAILGFAACFTIFLRSLVISLRGLVAGRLMHDSLLTAVLRAPMSFFEENPVGRILNRFSRDLEAIDLTIPRTLHEVTGCAFSILTTVLLIILVGPWALVGLVPVVYLYFMAQAYYRPAAREGQRLDSITRSPIFAQFSESLVGVAVIRAFGAMNRFERQLLHDLEINSRTFYTIVAANRWLGTRIETLGAGVVGSAAFCAVALHQSAHLGFTGLSVTYALAITGAMNWAIRMFSQLESNMSSVERIGYYSDLEPERWPGVEAPPQWPSAGTIEFDRLELRYRPALPAVIKGLSATIQSGEKVGLVGRTGSGKSSLLLGLYRILEASSGEIRIDGVNIATLSLSALRRALAIIPQDPVLFRGTVRKNLDPFGHHTDEELWTVLGRSHLESLVRALPLGLNAVVSEGGTNFSVGQRQLLCLARALLRRNKILLLDEATASVDVATDVLVQRTVRELFADCTVITIAHRLSTILDSDRIMVFETGRLVEFDRPRELSSKNSGALRALLVEAAV